MDCCRGTRADASRCPPTFCKGRVPTLPCLGSGLAAVPSLSGIAALDVALASGAVLRRMQDMMRGVNLMSCSSAML